MTRIKQFRAWDSGASWHLRNFNELDFMKGADAPSGLVVLYKAWIT